MKRFYRHPEDAYGNVEIGDYLNTEPVCIVYANHHPQAPEAILDGLEKKLGSVEMDECSCGRKKPVDWSYCGSSKHSEDLEAK